MRLSWEDVQREAAAAGFRAEPMEKALRLLEVLETLRSHPFLGGRETLGSFQPQHLQRPFRYPLPFSEHPL